MSYPWLDDVSGSFFTQAATRCKRIFELAWFHEGGRVVQWLVLSSLSKRVLGLNLQAGWSLACSPCSITLNHTTCRGSLITLQLLGVSKQHLCQRCQQDQHTHSEGWEHHWPEPGDICVRSRSLNKQQTSPWWTSPPVSSWTHCKDSRAHFLTDSFSSTVTKEVSGNNSYCSLQHLCVTCEHTALPSVHTIYIILYLYLSYTATLLIALQ